MFKLLFGPAFVSSTLFKVDIELSEKIERNIRAPIVSIESKNYYTVVVFADKCEIGFWNHNLWYAFADKGWLIDSNGSRICWGHKMQTLRVRNELAKIMLGKREVQDFKVIEEDIECSNCGNKRIGYLKGPDSKMYYMCSNCKGTGTEIDIIEKTVSIKEVTQ